jgi:sugar lactone lactonase YvrE
MTKKTRKPRLDPVRRELPPPPPRAGRTRSERPFPPSRLIPLNGRGPEDVVADAQGRLLCGVGDGRILRVEPESGNVEVVGDTGGRPLGLEMLGDGRVVVCDAYRGLLRLDPMTGAVETLVAPLRFCSNATAARDGTLYFTESTARFDLAHFMGALLEHSATGRLFRRDPDGRVEVLVHGLHFANGVTLTEDESALVFAETDGYRLSRLELRGPRSGERTILVDNMPGFPDNLSRSKGGRFWVAMVSPRNPFLDRLGRSPGWVRKALWRIPGHLQPKGLRTTWVMAFDEQGRLVEDLQSARDDFHAVTGVAEVGDRLYLASLARSALLEVRLT